jgi:threonylcarbamoyladenosine tRNA methylthiotransferase MtaB
MKIAVATLGCKVNQYETAAMLEALGDLSVVPFEATADCYIINTCTVTGKTDYQSRQLVRRALRSNPGATVIVTGCYAQRAPEEIVQIPGVTLVAGNEEKAEISNIIKNLTKDRPQVLVGNIGDRRQISNLAATTFAGHTRAFLKVQDGCNARCSYCIVPSTRGPSRSLPMPEVMRRLEMMAEKGYREVVLTGIHLGNYGGDLTPSLTLTDLVKNILADGKFERLRLSSIEPGEITDELLEMIRHSPALCRHLHIPLQSGDDSILRKMGRDYDTAFFQGLIRRIVGTIPDIAIGLDLMAGFPGEDEAAFVNNLRFVEELPVAYFHVFPYSRRPGTKAWAMPDQVREVDKKKRAEALRRLGREKRESFMKRLIGRRLAVLIEEGKNLPAGRMRGLSEHYMPVLITNGEQYHGNQIVCVVAEHFQDGFLVGSAVDPDGRKAGAS